MARFLVGARPLRAHLVLAALLLVHLQAFLQIGGALEPLAPAASATETHLEAASDVRLVGTGCPGTSQTCSVWPDYTLTFPSATPATLTYRVLQPSEADEGGPHCSSVRVNVYMDSQLVGTTPWMGWPGGPDPLTASLFLGNLSAGNHYFSFIGEGKESGCNVGDLIGWGGEMTIDYLVSTTQHTPECSDGTDNDGDGKTDFPHDPGCDSGQDDDETNGNSSSSSSQHSGADISVQKQGPSSAARGQEIPYTIVVKNNGGQTAGNVVVTDHIPSGATFVRASIDGHSTPQAQTIQTLIGDGCPGTSQTCSTTIPHNITITENSTAHLTYRVLQPSEADEGGPHCSSVRVHVSVDGQFKGTTEWMGWPGGPGPLTTSLALGTMSAGNHVVTYVGEGRESGCNVGDLIGWGGETTIVATPTDFSGHACSLQGNTVVCSAGTLNPGSQKTVTVVLRVDSCHVSSITNVAKVTSNMADTYNGNNESSVTTSIHGGQCGGGSSSSSSSRDFEVDITDNKRTVEAGDNSTYVIRVQNLQHRSVSNADLIVRLPSEVDIRDVSDDGDESGREVRWENLDFSSRETKTFEIDVRVDSDADDGDELKARATIEDASDTDETEVVGDDDDDEDDEDGELRLTKEANTYEVFPGGTIEYVVTLRNTGDGDITDVEVTDLLPGGVAVIDNGNADSISGNRLQWEFDELEEGDSITIRYRVAAVGVSPGQILRNDVRVTAEPDIDERASSTVSVIGQLPQTGVNGPGTASAFVSPMRRGTGGDSTGAPLAAWISLTGMVTGAGIGIGRKILLGL